MNFLFGNDTTTKSKLDIIEKLKCYQKLYNREDGKPDFKVGDYVCFKEPILEDSNLVQLRLPKNTKALILDIDICSDNETLGSDKDITIAVKDIDTMFINIIKSDSRLFCKFTGDLGDIPSLLQIFNKDEQVSRSDLLPGKVVRFRKGLRPAIITDEYTSIGNSYRNILEQFIVLRITDKGHRKGDFVEIKKESVHVAVIDKDSHKIYETSFSSYQLANPIISF